MVSIESIPSRTPIPSRDHQPPVTMSTLRRLASTLLGLALTCGVSAQITDRQGDPYTIPYPLGPAPSGRLPMALPQPLTHVEVALRAPGEILLVRSGEPLELDSLEAGRPLVLRPIEVRVRRTGARFQGIAFEFPGGAVAHVDLDEVAGLVRDLREFYRIDTSSGASPLGAALLRLRTRSGLEFTQGVRFDDRPVFELSFERRTENIARTQVRFLTGSEDKLCDRLERLADLLKK